MNLKIGPNYETWEHEQKVLSAHKLKQLRPPSSGKTMKKATEKQPDLHDLALRLTRLETFQDTCERELLELNMNFNGSQQKFKDY